MIFSRLLRERLPLSWIVPLSACRTSPVPQSGSLAGWSMHLDLLRIIRQV
jgi:hypothetical protein